MHPCLHIGPYLEYWQGYVVRIYKRMNVCMSACQKWHPANWCEHVLRAFNHEYNHISMAPACHCTPPHPTPYTPHPITAWPALSFLCLGTISGTSNSVWWILSQPSTHTRSFTARAILQFKNIQCIDHPPPFFSVFQTKHQGKVLEGFENVAKALHFCGVYVRKNANSKCVSSAWSLTRGLLQLQILKKAPREYQSFNI